MNSVNLIGRQVRQSECHTATNGKKYLEGAIAVSKSRDNVVFINYKAYDSQAEIIGKYINKGDLFGLSGSIEIQKWDGKDGNPRTEFYVLVGRCYLLGKSDSFQNVNAKAEVKAKADNFFEDVDL